MTELKRHPAGDMDYCERLAQRIVQSAMPELEMRFNVNQSGSVADFSLSRFGEICISRVVGKQSGNGPASACRGRHLEGRQIQKRFGKMCDQRWTSQTIDTSLDQPVARIDICSSSFRAFKALRMSAYATVNHHRRFPPYRRRLAIFG